MTRDEMEALFSRRQAAWKSHDAAALAADHSEDCVVESPFAGAVTGRAAIERIYRSFFTAFPDLDFRGQELLIDGDRAALRWTNVGTHVGDFMGISASGRRFQSTGVFLYQFRDGQIVRERRLWDFTSLLMQIGVLKAKPA